MRGDDASIRKTRYHVCYDFPKPKGERQKAGVAIMIPKEWERFVINIKLPSKGEKRGRIGVVRLKFDKDKELKLVTVYAKCQGMDGEGWVTVTPELGRQIHGCFAPGGPWQHWVTRVPFAAGFVT